MSRSCALCGFRNATTETEWEGRTFPACEKCVSPVEFGEVDERRLELLELAEHPERVRRGVGTTELVLALVLRYPGETVADICLRAGVPPDANRNKVVTEADRAAVRDYERITVALWRAERAGLVAGEGPKHGTRRFSPARDMVERIVAHEKAKTERRREITTRYHAAKRRAA